MVTLNGEPRGRQLRHWSKGFDSRRVAERALAQLLIEGREEPRTRNTVKSVVEKFIEYDRTPWGSKRSPTTRQGYEYLLGKIEPLFENRVDNLDGATIERFYDLLRRDNLSETTIHHVHNLLFSSFKWGKKRKVGLVSRNPFETDDIDRPRRAPSEAISLTRQQARDFLEDLVHTKHASALVFSLAAGCRRGENCGLKWSSVDFDRKVATIRESRYQVKGKVGQKRTKSNRVREIPLNQTALAALKAERIRQKRRRRQAGDAWVESGHVFTDELGAPLIPMTLTNAFGRCARRLGLPTTMLHSLRHTTATFILSAGGNPIAASKILGHASIVITLRLYGHVIDSDSVNAAGTIDDALRARPVSRRRPQRRRAA